MFSAYCFTWGLVFPSGQCLLLIQHSSSDTVIWGQSRSRLFFVALFYHQLFTMIVLLVKNSQRKPSHVSQTNGKKKKKKGGVPLLQQSLFRTLKKRSVQTLNFISFLFYIISFAIFLYDIFCFYSHWHFRRKYFSSYFCQLKERRGRFPERNSLNMSVCCCKRNKLFPLHPHPPSTPKD